jgi:hypothetical protein
MRRAGTWIYLSVLIVSLSGQTRLVLANEVAMSKPCSAPEYRRFDFWIGDWDAFDIDAPSKAVAHTHVDQILDGCVLLEDYQGLDGHHGQSFSTYDASTKVWRQSWVTNRGESLIIEGEWQDGAMVLSGSDQVGGRDRLVRGTWKPEGKTVRETAVISMDGGKTWTPWFDIVFRPHHPQNSSH